MRVLIVEDEPLLAGAIRDGLRLAAIAADVALDGDSALELLAVNAYDIAVLDRDIPGPSGDEVARHVVASGLGTPILMLTAADRLDDKASGFELGADDYLTKPFEMQELVLRLRALDRRRGHHRPPIREVAGLRVDPFRREVFRDGRYVALTRKQFAVLEVLVGAEGGVVSAEELLERAWDENADPFTNAVRITVSALRKRLGQPWIIATVAGVGYRIDTERDRRDHRPGAATRFERPDEAHPQLCRVPDGGERAAARGRLPLHPALRPRPGRTPSAPYAPNRSDLERAFLPRALQALAGAAGRSGSSAAGSWPAGCSRRCVDMTHATHLAADGWLSHRIRMEGRSDEFRQLADDFDTMLARLEAHDAEQQRFAANASHELRTPLAITQALLDVARQDPARGRDELVDQLHAVNARAIDLTEALLLLSRSDRRAFTPEPVDLSLAAEEAAETLLPLAEARGVTVEVVGEVATTVGSHALLLQLTTNLVHNAIVHNLPVGGMVRVTTRVYPGEVVLVVDNTGGVLTRAVVTTLVEPFQRGTGRVRTDHAGVGLGLAIVRSIVAAHGGSLELAPLDGGGLRVVVRLPPASG